VSLANVVMTIGSVWILAPTVLSLDRLPHPYAFSAYTYTTTNSLYARLYGAVLSTVIGTKQYF
jgi:hypothetical protein